MKSLFASFKRKLRDIKVNKTIRKLLTTEDRISSGIIDDLQEFSHDEITHVLRESYSSLEPHLQEQLLAVLEDQGYMEVIYDKLNNGSEREILYSLDLLALLKPPKALDSIFKKLADNRESIRFEAAYALILYRNQRVVELTIKELKQDSPYLPARLAQVLMGYGSLAVLELVNNLNNSEIDTDMVLEILKLMSEETTDEKVTECLAMNSEVIMKAQMAKDLKGARVEGRQECEK